MRKTLAGDHAAAVRTTAAYALGQLALDAPPASESELNALDRHRCHDRLVAVGHEAEVSIARASSAQEQDRCRQRCRAQTPATVSIAVDATAPGAAIERIWPFHGYDEVNYTTTPDGREGWLTLFLREGFPVYGVDRPNTGRIEFTPRSMELFLRLRDDGKPALVFAAHLANWELPPLAAGAYGMPAAVVYRRPNLGAVAEAIIPLRAGSMGELIPSDRAVFAFGLSESTLIVFSASGSSWT